MNNSLDTWSPEDIARAQAVIEHAYSGFWQTWIGYAGKEVLLNVLGHLLHDKDLARQTSDILVNTLRDGGGTFTLQGKPAVFSTGYAVATGEQTFMDLGGIQDIETFTALVRRAQQSGSTYIGTWIDSGKLYIEPTAVLQNLDHALELARQHKQQSIYSFADKVSVTVDAIDADTRVSEQKLKELLVSGDFV